jgi:outer membrane protein assembly factor BamB
VPAPQTSAPPKPNEPADGSDAPTPLEDIGFMGAPIGYGSLLIVPVNNGGSIYVYALDIRQEGKVVWKSFLTDEPPGGASFWSPIQLSLEGSDLFALCGSGALFVLEPATGGIRFARRYPRTGKYDRSGERFGMSTQRLILDGWSEDIAIPYRNLVLVLASDLNMIHAYDRQDGKLKWEAPTSADADARVNYLLGVHDDLLFAGGPEELIAYDLKGEGRMLWTASWTARDYLKQANAKSFGRGMVTPGAVYLPIKNSILKLDLKTGKPVASASVQLGYDGPVGNLFSDGQRFWVVSANRVMALENVSASDDKQSSPQDSDDKTGDGEESDGERGLSTTDEPNRANGS